MMPNRIITLWCAMLLLPATFTFGQKGDDGPVGIFSSRAEYNQFMGTAKRAAYGPSGNDELKAMIPMINDIALDQPIGTTAKQYDARGSVLGLLSDPDIRAELEMVDEQYESLKEINSETQQRLGEQLRTIDFQNKEELAQQLQELRKQAQEDMDSVLLPHQISRLRQIQMQSILRRRSLVDVLTSDPLKSELDISERQSNELRAAERQIEQELARKIERLKENAMNELLSRLKPTQKRAVQEMIGEAFEFSKSEPEKDSGRKKRSRQ